MIHSIATPLTFLLRNTMDQKFFEEKRHRRESIAPDWRECHDVFELAEQGRMGDLLINIRREDCLIFRLVIVNAAQDIGKVGLEQQRRDNTGIAADIAADGIGI